MNYFNEKYEITNIVNYLRRSRQDVQREKLTGEDTLASQEKLMTNVLNNLGIPYVLKKEIGSGDKIATRPVFKDVLTDLENGKFDAIAVKEISRLGRGSYKDMGTIFELITEKRIFIITPNKIYDPTNNADLKQIRFEMFMSREEFETTRERLTGARYVSAQEGKWMGTVPFGYERNKKTMRLEPKKGEMETIQLIFNLFVNGYEGRTVREKAISSILKKAGISSPKDCKNWDATQLKRMLTNDVYIGVSKFKTTKRTAKGKVEARDPKEHIRVHDAHEPIISKEVFEKVQEIKKTPAVKHSVKLNVDIYELTGLFTCKECGGKTVVNKYLRRRKNSEFYDCYVKCRRGCFAVKYEPVEDGILNFIKSLQDMTEDECIELYEKSQVKKDDAEQAMIQEHFVQQLEEQKKALEKRLTFIFDKYEAGIYSDDDFVKRKQSIETELKELETLSGEQAHPEIASAQADIDIVEVKKKLVNILEAYNNKDVPSVKNEILRKLFDKVTMEILKKGTKKSKPQIHFDVVLSQTFWK